MTKKEEKSKVIQSRNEYSLHLSNLRDRTNYLTRPPLKETNKYIFNNETLNNHFYKNNVPFLFQLQNNNYDLNKLSNIPNIYYNLFNINYETFRNKNSKEKDTSFTEIITNWIMRRETNQEEIPKKQKPIKKKSNLEKELEKKLEENLEQEFTIFEGEHEREEKVQAMLKENRLRESFKKYGIEPFERLINRFYKNNNEEEKKEQQDTKTKNKK